MFLVGCTHATTAPSSAAATAQNQYVYVVRPSRPEMLTSGPTEREIEVLKGHVAFMQKLTDEGTLLLAGRTQNNDPSTFGLAIFVAPSEAAAEEIMNEDPAVKHGVMTATLYPYEIAFGTLSKK